jgi:integration host factor subunit alpha
MTDQTITRADLAEAVVREAGLGRPEASQLLEDTLDIIEGAIARGELVKLSRFGNFVVRHKHQRVGRNPKTGEEVPITPRWVVTFRPSQILRQRVEAGGQRKRKPAARPRAETA